MPSNVYIAGVGFSPSSSASSSGKDAISSLVSAVTKALLDAGLTYDEVSHGVTGSKEGSQVFKAFGEGGIGVEKVKTGSELSSSVQVALGGTSRCILAIATGKSGATALVLVSENLLWRYPYLKDSSASIRQQDAASSKPKSQTGESFDDICQIVWSLRGWLQSKGTAGKTTTYHYLDASKKSFEISRADAQAVPEWKDVEHKQDGKHRLGYNPAAETRDIHQEDFEAVRAIGRGSPKASDKTQLKHRGGDRAALAKL